MADTPSANLPENDVPRVCRCNLIKAARKRTTRHAATSHLTKTRAREGARPLDRQGRTNLGRPPQRNACDRRYTAVTRYTTPRHASLSSLRRGEGALSGARTGGESIRGKPAEGVCMRSGVARPGDDAHKGAFVVWHAPLLE